jgi:hypothetical protein
MNQRSGVTALTLLLAAGAAASTFAQQGSSPQQQSASTQASNENEKETVGEISDDVAQVRFQKLGYKNFGTWTRKGDYLETTATKDGKSYQLRLDVRTGARDEKQVPAPK